MKGNLAAVVGADTFNVDFELSNLQKFWLGEKSNDPLSKTTFYGDELNWESIAEDYDTVNLFADKKVLLVRQSEKISLDSQKRIFEVVKTPNDQTCLIFTGLKLDGRSPLVKHIKKMGYFVEFKAPYPDKIPVWIITYAAKKLNRKINRQSALLLQDYIGNELQLLGQELDKLHDFVAKGSEITESHIQSLLIPQRQKSYFELQKNMGMKKTGKAMMILSDLLNQGEPAFLIAMNLFYHINKLLKIRMLSENGMAPQQIPNHLNINQFIFKKENFLAQAMSRPIQQLQNALIQLSKLESALKQGIYPEKFQIEIAFSEILF